VSRSSGGEHLRDGVGVGVVEAEGIVRRLLAGVVGGDVGGVKAWTFWATGTSPVPSAEKDRRASKMGPSLLTKSWM
jgi:hypothetical protein